MKEVSVKMTLKKSTKGTNVYEAAQTAVPTIYVRKDKMPNPAPAEMTLTLTFEE